ncbi:hypothetical protein C7999DRAFT_44970 [Corynascus novoguineensis]|uniref:Uncharacterized protein n=1 Tax=Corynascus novoguineensis TaxID=1126955 RepID=A0AAN7HIG8_9PEZI|nr:hypothetical protein C7999DRAFT_44970 [Corynascus novoguineensis]
MRRRSRCVGFCLHVHQTSKDHRDLLHVVDRLRSQGLSRFVDLPQIIVCGDQSSGKSSVLEAISGMSFPAKDNLCTRFATELILRRAPAADVDIRITPGPERSDKEKTRQKDFTYSGTPADLDISHVIDDTKSAMDLNRSNKVFSTDLYLTMVDLPGLFLAGNKDQSDKDTALVEALVLLYMKMPRTIILAVQVTRHARALDPMGTRTLGLITKPDTLDEGSDSERFFVELAQNNDVRFRLGWHVLRNRNYAERENSSAARDAVEADFFSKGIWTTLKASQLGVAALRLRLSNVLRDQVLRQLPGVLDDVRAGVQDCKNILARLGTARATVIEQRRYLLKLSAGFSNLASAAIDGVYTDAFFRGSYDRRLRAVMRDKGHAKTITERPVIDYESDCPVAAFSDEDEDDGAPQSISRSVYIEEVRELIRESRRRELPGTYNPMIVAELFSKQCKPWQSMVRCLLERVFGSASMTIEAVLRHVADGETAEALLHVVINPTMDNIKKELTNKADEILEPYISGHPITYNHYLTDNVQKAQSRRTRQRLEERLKSFFRKDKLKDGATNYWFDMQVFLDALATHTEPDMDIYSCSIAIDMMEAYYKTLVDDVSNLAIERCLLQKLPSILTPEIVYDFTDDEVQRIVEESIESAIERARAPKKLGML